MSQFHFEGGNYTCDPDETLLQALLRQGAELPHSCRKGSCHTCVLKIDSGSVRLDRNIDPALSQAGYTLACVARPDSSELSLRRAHAGELGIEVELVGRQQLAEGIFAVQVATARDITFRAGQFLNLEGPDGLVRPYSIASRVGDDYFLTLHVRLVPGGRMSTWLCRTAPVGQRLRAQGPFGNCSYDTSLRERPLHLLATGSGAGALAALAREALDHGHRAGITLHHGVRHAADLYLHDALQAMARSHPNFSYRPRVSGEAVAPPVLRGRVVYAAFGGADMRDAAIFLCGLPQMVEEARYRARLAGVPAARIHADPFEFAHPRMPRDAEKLAGIQPDPELWRELGGGPRLTRILDTFYTRVFADARLSPFFHNVTKDRAVQKQYEFLASLLTGSGEYFGLNPFNAHHWMVISDELFDHREAMFEQVLREEQLPPHLVDRWMALHELFRAEIVKSRGRGIVSQGVEQPLRTQSLECLDIDTVCDGCATEIPAGRPSRYLFRMGRLHCEQCAGIQDHSGP